MSETPSNTPAGSEEPVAVVAPEPGPVGQWLNQQGFDHDSLEPDHLGVEQIGVEAAVLPMIAAALKSNGFDYLQCQGGYDEGPGEQLVVRAQHMEISIISKCRICHKSKGLSSDRQHIVKKCSSCAFKSRERASS